MDTAAHKAAMLTIMTEDEYQIMIAAILVTLAFYAALFII